MREIPRFEDLCASLQTYGWDEHLEKSRGYQRNLDPETASKIDQDIKRSKLLDQTYVSMGTSPDYSAGRSIIKDKVLNGKDAYSKRPPSKSQTDIDGNLLYKDMKMKDIPHGSVDPNPRGGTVYASTKIDESTPGPATQWDFHIQRSNEGHKRLAEIINAVRRRDRETAIKNGEPINEDDYREITLPTPPAYNTGFTFTLHPNTRILALSNLDDMEKLLLHKYSTPTGEFREGKKIGDKALPLTEYAVNWGNVAKDFDAVHISQALSNQLKGRRLQHLKTYGSETPTGATYLYPVINSEQLMLLNPYAQANPDDPNDPEMIIQNISPWARNHETHPMRVDLAHDAPDVRIENLFREKMEENAAKFQQIQDERKDALDRERGEAIGTALDTMYQDAVSGESERRLPGQIEEGRRLKQDAEEKKARREQYKLKNWYKQDLDAALKHWMAQDQALKDKAHDIEVLYKRAEKKHDITTDPTERANYERIMKKHEKAFNALQKKIKEMYGAEKNAARMYLEFRRKYDKLLDARSLTPMQTKEVYGELQKLHDAIRSLQYHEGRTFDDYMWEINPHFR